MKKKKKHISRTHRTAKCRDVTLLKLQQSKLNSDAMKVNTNFDTVAKSNIAIEQESHLFEKD